MASPLMEVTTCKTHSPGLTSRITLDPFPFGKLPSSVMGFWISRFHHFENSWKIPVLTKNKNFCAILLREIHKFLQAKKKKSGL